MFFSLPTFDDFEVATENPQPYETLPPIVLLKGKPSYPNKRPFTTKYEIPASVSDEAGYSEPPSKLNGEEQPMYPSLKPPPPQIKVQTKPKKHNNIAKPGTVTDVQIESDDLRKPPFKFPLKEYAQELLQLNFPKFGTKNPLSQGSLINPLSNLVDETTTSIPQTTQYTNGLDNEFTIPQFNFDSEENVKNEISQIVEKEKSTLLHTDFYNNTIAEFFNKAKNKTNQELNINTDPPSFNLNKKPSFENLSQDVVIKVTVKPMSFLQKVMNFKSKNKTSIDKVGKSPKPFVSFGSDKKGTKIPNRVGPYIVTSEPPPNYSINVNNGLKYTYTVFTSPPGLQVTVRPHAYQTRPVKNFDRPSQSIYEMPEDVHDKKFDVINKFQTDFR